MDHGIWRDWPPTPAYRSPDWRVDAVCKTELEKDAMERRVSKRLEIGDQQSRGFGGGYQGDFSLSNKSLFIEPST